MNDLEKKLDVWNVEFDNGDVMNEYFYRDERNAKAKFDEIVEKYNLTVKGCWGKNDFGVCVWVGKIVFED